MARLNTQNRSPHGQNKPDSNRLSFFVLRMLPEELIHKSQGKYGDKTSVSDILRSPQFRFVSLGNDQLQTAALNWVPLEQHSVETVFRQGGLLKSLWNECESLSIPATALVLFCAEGNNIPESLGMSSLFIQLLRAPEVLPNQWKFPPSWANMEEGLLRASDIY
jgi:hypothetical protein